MEKSTKKKTLKQFMRRYWYWFVAVPVLITVSFVWLYLIGVFDTVKPIVISTNTPKYIDMYVDSTYHMMVTSDSDRTPVYSSSRPYVVEVDDDGFLIAHDEGITVITADFGVKKYEVTVNVYSYSNTWYLTSGDTFTEQDIYRAFPEVSHTIQSFSVSGSEYLQRDPGGEPGNTKFSVVGDIAEDAMPIFASVGAPSKKNDQIFSNKGQLTIFLVPTQELKAEKTAALEKSRAESKTPLPEIPDRIDEEKAMVCGYSVDFRPHLTTEGHVTYILQNIPNEFPVVVDQRGSVNVQALLTEFYVVALVEDSGEIWRWKCTAEPPSMDIDLVVGEEIQLYDYKSYISVDIARIECSSRKIETLCDEDGLWGLRALEASEQQLYVDCYSSADKNYITFRIIVTISDVMNAGAEGENG